MEQKIYRSCSERFSFLPIVFLLYICNTRYVLEPLSHLVIEIFLVFIYFFFQDELKRIIKPWNENNSNKMNDNIVKFKNTFHN